MKMLQTTGIYPSDIGGFATFSPKFAITLVEMGRDVRILTLTNDFNWVEDSLLKTLFISLRSVFFRKLELSGDTMLIMARNSNPIKQSVWRAIEI
jgi:hypothetical protein